MPFWFQIMIKRHFFLKYYCLLSPAICLLWELFYSVTFRFYRFLVLFFKLIKSLLLDNLELFTAQMSRMMSELNILRTFNQHLSYIIKIIITISKYLKFTFPQISCTKKPSTWYLHLLQTSVTMHSIWNQTFS